MSAILSRYLGRKFSVDDDGLKVVLMQRDNDRKNSKIFYLKQVAGSAEVAADV